MRVLVLPLVSTLIFGSLLLNRLPEQVRKLRSEYELLSAPPLSRLRPELVNVLLLGNKDLYDDFINIWLLQILVDPRMGQDAERMMGTIRSVIKHKPRLETLYMLSCFVMQKDFNRPEFCREIIHAGLAAFPQSWRLPMIQGWVEAFQLNNPAQASRYFVMAASRPKSPEYVAKAAKLLVETRFVTPEDLQRSLEITLDGESKSEFLKLLEGIGRAPKPMMPVKPE